MQAHSFVKMIHFTRLIKAGGRLREFNLRKLNSPDAEMFSVDTVDDRGNRIIFRIQKQADGTWAILPLQQPLLPWIKEIEPLLQQEIEDELQHN